MRDLTITTCNNEINFSGEINFANVMKALDRCQHFIAERDNPVNFNLTHVTHCNSAGLALFLQCVKFANNAHKSINIINTSQQILDIASIAGIQHLLPFEENNLAKC